MQTEDATSVEVKTGTRPEQNSKLEHESSSGSEEQLRDEIQVCCENLFQCLILQTTLNFGSKRMIQNSKNHVKRHSITVLFHFN